jgi:two-component system, LuxR family, response regulator FixJ
MPEIVPLVHVLDDATQVQAFVRALLEGSGYEMRGYGEPMEFLEELSPRSPQCLLLDLRMPRMSGLEVLRQLQVRGLAMPAIMMTGFGSVHAAVEAFKLGVMDFIEKPFEPDAMLDAIARAIARDRQDAELRQRQKQVQELLATLTAREREVYDSLVAGNSSKRIAFELKLSKKTIDLHRSRVMKKLGVSSLVALTRLALAGGQGSESAA